MRISVQTGGAQQIYGVGETYRLFAEAGFDSVDANINDVVTWDDITKKHPLSIFDQSEANMLEVFRPWLDASVQYGLDNYQAHAPFPSYIADSDDAYNDYMIDVLKKTIHVCDFIHCRRLVVHPFFLGYENDLGSRKEWEVNIDRYSRLIPAAKEYGVTILLENMFSTYNGKCYSACCSNFELAAKYVDTLNSIAGYEAFGFCMDTGHALLLGLDIKNAMMTMGPRIKAFHVHDNNGLSDQHYAPFYGVQDWNRFSEGLKAIQYEGDLSFETYNILRKVDPELHPEVLRFICKAGHLFAKKAGL